MSNLATIVNNILADSGIDDINVVVTTGSYANPAWITSLAWTKITGAPANIVTGTGTTNTLPKFTGASTIGNSNITDSGSLIQLLSNTQLQGKLYYTYDWLQEKNFGYSSGWKTLAIGSLTSANNFSLAFGVDVSGNPSGSFTGNGNEYFWRNTGSFKTPNAANNGYNQLFEWNSSGGMTFNQAAEFIGTVTVGSPLSIKSTTPYIQWINASSTRLAYIQHNATNLVYNADTGVHVFNQNIDLNFNSPNITLSSPAYSGSYKTILGALSSAQGFLQLGNNGANYIVAGNSFAGGHMFFYVNATSSFLSSVNGTLALTLSTSGAATFSSLAGTGTRMVVADANGLLSTQAIGSGAITGSGTTNYLPKFTGSSTIGDSSISDVASSPLSIVKNASSITSNLIFISPTTGTNASILQLDNSGAGSFYIGRQNSAGNSVLLSGLGAYASVIGHTGSQTLHLVTNAISRVQIDGTGAATFSSTGSFGNGTLNGAYFIIKGVNGVPATTGTTTQAVLRLSSGTGLYNVLDFGTNEALDYSWIQSTRANSLGTYDYLAIQPNGGNLLVGTTANSTFKLDVNGTGRFSGALTFAANVWNTSGGNNRFYFDNANTYFGSPSFWVFQNNSGSNVVSINSAGAVTFSSSITASGNLNLQGAVTRNINFYDSSNTNINAQIQYDQLSSNTGQLFFGTNNAGTFATRLTIASSGAATFSSSVTIGSIVALTPSGFGYDPNGYRVLIVGQTGNSIFKSLAFGVDVSGNPSGAFSGSGSEYVWRNTASFITPNASNNGYNTLLSWNSSGQITIPGATTIGSLTLTGGFQIGDYSQATNSLTFAASSNGIAKINFYDSNSTEGLYLRTDGESYGGTMTFGARWDDDEAKIVFKMYQTSAGATYNARVGIGNTSPNATLDVRGDNGNSASALVRLRDTNATSRTTRLQFEDYAGAYADGLIDFVLPTAGTATGARLSLGVSVGTLHLLNGGNVGIGTSNPLYKLEVNGTNGSIAVSGSGYITNPIPMIIGQYTSTRGYIQVPNQGSFEIWNGGTSAIVEFKNNSDSQFYGNVGIGTSPVGKLTVKQPYNSGTTPIYFGNTSFTAWNRQSYDTFILQQDDVTSFRMVEKNGETTASDQVLTFSIGDGAAVIASSAQPMKFYTNGSPSGLAYQGLSGTLALTLQTNGNALFGYNVTAANGNFNDYVIIDNQSLNNPKFLQFDANISAGANTSLGDIRWYNKQWDSSIKAQIVALTDTDITNGRLSFRTGTSGVAAIERLRISSTGAANFYSTLDVASTISTSGSIVSTVGGTSELRLRGGGYGGNYNTSLRSIAGAIGILQFGNNADNYILVGNTGTGAYLDIRVNCSSESITSGSLALRIGANTAATFYSSVTATAFFESSDRRLKSNILDLDVNVSSIIAKTYLKNGVEEIGYLAQDVESILPSAISKRDDGYLDLSYRQVHTAKIAYLEKRITELEQQLKNK